MNKNMMRIIVAILVVSLTALACGVQIITSDPILTSPSPTSKINAPTEAPVATEAPAATNEPPHEIYAGFTDDPSMPFVMIHKTGENMALTQDVKLSTVTGAVWTSPDGNSVVIYADKNGKPTGVVVGKQVILFSNYTADTVDLTIIKADGTKVMAQSKLDMDVLQKITAIQPAPSAYDLISFSRPSLQREELDKWFWMKTGLYMFDVAVCTTGVLTAASGVGSVAAAAAAGFFAAAAPGTILALANACTGALLGTLTRVGKILDLDVSFLENLGNSTSILNCADTLYSIYNKELQKIMELGDLSKLKSCLKPLITAAQSQEQLASQEWVGTGRGQQIGEIEDWTVSSLRGTVTQLSNCRYGPDWPYLYKYGVGIGTKMEVIGRDADGDWLNVQGLGGNNACWIKAAQIQIDGDAMSLPDTYPFPPSLTISPFFEQITITSVSYSGGMVNVSWLEHIIRSDLSTEQGTEYIVEVWTCVDGKPAFYALGLGPDETSASFQIDNNCGVASHADVIGEDKEGFSIPAIIILP